MRTGLVSDMRIGLVSDMRTGLHYLGNLTGIFLKIGIT